MQWFADAANVITELKSFTWRSQCTTNSNSNVIQLCKTSCAYFFLQTINKATFKSSLVREDHSILQDSLTGGLLDGIASRDNCHSLAARGRTKR